MKKKAKKASAVPPSEPTQYWALAFFLVLSAAFFSESLFFGKVMLLRDVASQFYPPRWFFRETLLNGEFPFWCDRMFGGYPFHANPQNAVFYPLTLLFVVFPPDYAIAVSIALHGALLSFFTSVFVRSFGVSFAGSLLAGLVMAFAGLPLKHAEFLELYGSVTWMPLAFYFLRILLREGGWRPSVALAAVLAVQFLAGSPYPTFFTLIGLGGYAIFQGGLALRGYFSWTPSRLWMLAGAGLLFFGLTAVQLLPTAALTRQMPPEALKVVFTPLFSFRIIDGLNFLLPYLFGYPDWQKCVYVGLLPLLIIPFAIYGTRRTENALTRDTKAEVWFFVVLVVLSLILAAGNYLSIDRLLAQFPLISRFYKWPTLALALGIFGLAVLTGLGFEVMRKSRNERGIRIMIFGMGGVVAILLVAAVLDGILGNSGSQALRARFAENLLGIRSEAAQPANYPLRVVVWRFGLLLAVTMACVAAYVLRPSQRRMFFAGLLGILAADKFLFGFALHFHSPVNVYRMPGPTAERILEKEDDLAAFRVYAPMWISGLNDSTYGSRKPEDFLLLKTLLADTSFLPSGLRALHGGGVLRLPQFDYDVLPWLEALPPDEKNRILGRSSVKYQIDVALESGSVQYAMKENFWFVPRVYLSPAARTVADEKEAAAAILAPEFDPAREIVVQGPAVETTAAEFAGRIQETDFRTNSLRVCYQSDVPAYLVVTDTYTPDWRAQIDGKPADVLKANVWQRAVAVPAGEHTVVLRYSSPTAQWGLAITIVSVIAAGLIWFFAPKRRA